MEVGLDADSLHHQVLRHPGHELLLHRLLQLLHLGSVEAIRAGIYWSSCAQLACHYLLSHVGLRKVVEDESDLLLDVLWRLHNPFRLVRGHQQRIDVGSVYGRLQVGTETVTLIVLSQYDWTCSQRGTYRHVLLEAAGCWSCDGGRLGYCGCSCCRGNKSAGLARLWRLEAGRLLRLGLDLCESHAARSGDGALHLHRGVPWLLAILDILHAQDI